MMKTSRRVTSCCVALFFALTSVSAEQKWLDSINDLKEINFGQSVPKHSLVLLHWFANTVDIDENDEIWLTFDPDDGDYGSHHYGNYEGLLDPLPWGNGDQYYTIGNLYQETSMPLPPYVARFPGEYVERNRDRIIIRVREQNTGWPRIDQIYITQHIEHQAEYDPEHTYQITTNLLREIREFSVGENQQPLGYLRRRYGSNADDFNISITWGHLACLGLLLFIVIEEKYSSIQQNNRPENDRPKINDRQENNDRPKNNDRLKNDRPENSDRPKNNDRPENNDRLENNDKLKNDRLENSDRSKNNDRLENNGTLKNDRPENNDRLENNGRLKNDRPENNDRQENNNRPENDDRLENNNTQENKDRLQNNDRPESNYSPENDRLENKDRPKKYRPKKQKTNRKTTSRRKTTTGCKNRDRSENILNGWDVDALANGLVVVVLFCLYSLFCSCILAFYNYLVKLMTIHKVKYTYID